MWFFFEKMNLEESKIVAFCIRDFKNQGIYYFKTCNDNFYFIKDMFLNHEVDYKTNRQFKEIISEKNLEFHYIIKDEIVFFCATKNVDNLQIINEFLSTLRIFFEKGMGIISYIYDDELENKNYELKKLLIEKEVNSVIKDFVLIEIENNEVKTPKCTSKLFWLMPSIISATLFGFVIFYVYKRC